MLSSTTAARITVFASVFMQFVAKKFMGKNYNGIRKHNLSAMGYSHQTRKIVISQIILGRAEMIEVFTRFFAPNEQPYQGLAPALPSSTHADRLLRRPSNQPI